MSVVRKNNPHPAYAPHRPVRKRKPFPRKPIDAESRFTLYGKVIAKKNIAAAGEWLDTGEIGWALVTLRKAVSVLEAIEP